MSVKFNRDLYFLKKPCIGKLVVVLDGKLENRNLKLTMFHSRAISKGQIHELIVTNDNNTTIGGTVDRVAYIGFFEVEEGSLVVIEDKVRIGNHEIGQVSGFDETHMPNHLNIVVKSDSFACGAERGLILHEEVRIGDKSCPARSVQAIPRLIK